MVIVLLLKKSMVLLWGTKCNFILKLGLANEWLYPCWLVLTFPMSGSVLLARTCFSLRRDLSWSWSPSYFTSCIAPCNFYFFYPNGTCAPRISLHEVGLICGSCFSVLHRLGFMTHIPFPLFVGCFPNNSHIYTK